jgi:AraC-like DNA-binding protein
MRVYLTRSATVLPFSGFLEAGGCDASRYLGEAGIAPEALDAQEALIPLHQASRFIEGTARREGIENLGLEVGARTSASGLGLFGMVLQQSLNLKELVEKLIRWVPLLDSGAQVWLEPAANQACVRLCIRHHVGTGRSMVNDYGMMLLIDALRMAAGPEWRPTSVSLDLTKARDLSGFEALSEASFESNPDFAAIAIPRELLGAPVLGSRGQLSLEAVAEGGLMGSAPPLDLVGSIASAIRVSMETRIPSIGEAAELAGTSVRSLQRGLGKQGAVYRELVERVRYEAARELLGDPGISVSEIANRLGYSEVANFSHAFLRWSGIPPSQFRGGRPDRGEPAATAT